MTAIWWVELFHLHQIFYNNIPHQEYAIQVTLRQLWSDPRLSFEDREGKIRYLILNDPSQIWLPDLFFANEKKAHFHNIVTPNIYLRISSNGDVLYSTRISLKLSCPMDLKKFPMDEQVCTLRVASCKWFLYKKKKKWNLMWCVWRCLDDWWCCYFLGER